MEHKKEDWPSHVKSWQTGNLSQAEYCCSNGLKQPAFSYWKKRLNDPVEPEFVALEKPTNPPLIELTIRRGFNFELRLNFHLFWSNKAFK